MIGEPLRIRSAEHKTHSFGRMYELTTFFNVGRSYMRVCRIAYSTSESCLHWHNQTTSRNVECISVRPLLSRFAHS